MVLEVQDVVDELHQLLEIMYAAAEWETLRDAEAFPSIVFFARERFSAC